MDFETNRSLSEVGVYLTHDEVDESCAYLQAMQARLAVNRIHLSKGLGNRLKRDITVGIDGRASLI